MNRIAERDTFDDEAAMNLAVEEVCAARGPIGHESVVPSRAVSASRCPIWDHLLTTP